MDITQIRRRRLAQLIAMRGTQADFIRETGQNQSEISGLLKNKSFGEKKARKIEEECGLERGWLDRDARDEDSVVSHGELLTTGIPGGHFTLSSAENSPLAVGKIPYWEARGSCGGGFLNYDELPKGHLVKEATFFQRYGLRPDKAIAVYADGDSMADFIVDGDIVIFDTSKTEPESGKIFLIHHPDGLRIKELRRGIDGAWMLQSRNQNKTLYPDERIEPSQGELLKIYGRFVYRQGGE